MPWQQHQAAVWGCFERRREEERLPPFPSQADMWYSCWAVTRTHHTHRLYSHPPMHRLEIAHPPLHLSLSLSLHLHVNFSPGCHLPTQSSISPSVCLAGRINGLSLEQVLILLQWTRLEPPDWNSLLHQCDWAISMAGLCFCQRLLVKPSRTVAQCLC